MLTAKTKTLFFFFLMGHFFTVESKDLEQNCKGFVDVYTDFHQWFKSSRTLSIEQQRQGYLSFVNIEGLDPLDTKSVDSSMSAVEYYHQDIEYIAEYAISMCRSKKTGLSEIWYKIETYSGEYSRVGILLDNDGKITTAGFEDQEFQEQIDDGLVYEKITKN